MSTETNMRCLAISGYPLSGEMRVRLARELGIEQFLTLSELRQRRSLLRMISDLRGTCVERVVVTLEDESSTALLPILKGVALLIGAGRREIVGPDLRSRPFSRFDAVASLLKFASASFAGVVTGICNYFELSGLLKARRMNPRKAGDLRVLFLNANLWFGLKAGGSVGHISGVVNAFMDSGAQLIFATVGGRLLVDQRAEVVTLHAPAAFGAPFELNYHRFHRMVCGQLLTLAAEGQFGFIYQRLSIGNYSGVALSRRLSVPLIVEYNGSEAWVARHWGRALAFHELAARAEEAMLRHAHLVVTVSEVLRDELRDRGVEPERIVCYPNCIDPDTFTPERFPDECTRRLRVSLGIDEDAIVVTFVGTFGQWHGAEKLAAAISRLSGERLSWLKARKVRFVFVGDGLRMPLVKETLTDAALAGIVTYTGLVPQVEAPRYLAMSDVLVSPHVANADGSRFFGSPTKLFEYMAMGKAIIASDLEQIGQVLRPGLRADNLIAKDPCASDDQLLAVLTEPGNVEHLAHAIEFLVEHPRWRVLLGANARREVLTRYTWRHHVDAIVSGARRVGIL
jgi:glycosyltransferase involved in cell wall biosynthesis